MSDAPDPPMSPETAVTELSLAIGQLVRRLRMEANSSELTWSQTATLARLDKLGWMTTADHARAESVKPHRMGATLADPSVRRAAGAAPASDPDRMGGKSCSR